MQLVKKARKNWECLECGKEIKTGESMFRKSIHRWKQEIYCLDCGKPEIEKSLKSAKKSIKCFPKSDDERSTYQLFVGNAQYYEAVLNHINAQN